MTKKPETETSAKIEHVTLVQDQNYSRVTIKDAEGGTTVYRISRRSNTWPPMKTNTSGQYDTQQMQR